MSSNDPSLDPAQQDPVAPQPVAPQPVAPLQANPYAQQPVAPQPVAQPAKKTRSAQSMSIISVITGAISIFLFGAVLGTIGVITGVGAIAQHAAERKNGTSTGPTPLILGVTGLVLGAIGLIGMLIFVLS